MLRVAFFFNIYRNSKLKTGWKVQLSFLISLHKKDRELLERIKNHFGVGWINEHHGPNSIQYSVQSIYDLEKIIYHIDKYPLITQKMTDYILWNKIFFIVKTKEHLTLEGLKKTFARKASINKGDLPDNIKAALPDITPADRPLVTNKKIPDPNWLAGFAEGDGSFFCECSKIF